MPTADNTDLTDIGPATPPPNWCLPDAQPEWNVLVDGGGMVCQWERKISDDVWIWAEDRVIDGRIMRSAPRIMYWEPPRDGIDGVQAHELAQALIAAADVIACAAFDEAQR